jgi:UDPglucose 6-dehydrogenase
MSNYSVAIVGYGAVGKSINKLFPNAVVYDPPLGLGSKEEVNKCRFTFICVPTPMLPNGSTDISIVEESVKWINSGYIIIRSTIPVGTTDTLEYRYDKDIIFQPEYGPADTPEHPYNDPYNIRWIILGGNPIATHAVINLYKTVFNSSITIQQTSASTAELVKYMENCFLATKVAFCNEFYDIASKTEVDYNELRELWLLDPRIGRSHTFVFEDNRGFGGNCLPKDLSEMIFTAKGLGVNPKILSAVLESNIRS